MPHTLLIGGSGFIGIHLAKLLSDKGRKITVIGKNQIPSNLLPEDVNYISGNFGNQMFLMEILKNVDEIVHLAYTSTPKTSFENPIDDIFNNLSYSVKLFEVAQKFDIKKIVFISTGGAVYGNAVKLPIDEKHKTDPVSPYGITKLSIEKYALMFHHINGLPIIILRPGNAYGEGQIPFKGQGFVATAIASILKNIPINLFGENGTIRDYIYVKDLANAIYLALENAKIGEIYNIGTKIGKSNRDILDILFEFAKDNDLKYQLNILPERAFDVKENILDNTKFINDTGWIIKTDITEGLKKTWDYYAHSLAL
ncbi:MAG TPA: NAD-dependent epimerase/dehydratase family protein [Spirochaetota bacterium]|nr:NAD-dependent epimerase/dehydratase family protein [Spirochaetota bacterium]